MILISNPDKSQWQEILKRPVMNTENLFDTVRSVIDRVKEEGDRAVLDYEEKFDKVVYVPTQGCMNLAASVNVILYDRLAKRMRGA